jgi:hypothetical protein
VSIRAEARLPFQKERTEEANAKTVDCDDNTISSSYIRGAKLTQVKTVLNRLVGVVHFLSQI